jgi:hypothetical protein
LSASIVLPLILTSRHQHHDIKNNICKTTSQPHIRPNCWTALTHPILPHPHAIADLNEMAEPTSEQRELSLVEKVDFRILNVANNEQKLQDLLSKFLVPLLLKGASEHASVRAKVATVAQRLKLFIKPPGYASRLPCLSRLILY